MMFAIAAALLSSSPCDGRVLAEGPVPAGFGEGDFGVVRGACPRTEVGLGLDGRAIVETANFYGNVRAAGRLDLSGQPFPQLEFYVTTELLSYQLVIQSFKADRIGYGDTSAGATLLAFAHDNFALSVTTRVDLPTSFGLYQNAFPVGLEAGLLGVIEPAKALRLHGGLLGGTSFAITKASPNTRGAIIANAGVDVLLTDWWSLVGDLDGQALQRGDLDLLGVAVGTRFDICGVGLEAGAVVPVAGAERSLASFIVRGSYRF